MKKFAASAAAAALVLLLSGCGSQDSSASPEDSAIRSESVTEASKKISVKTGEPQTKPPETSDTESQQTTDPVTETTTSVTTTVPKSASSTTTTVSSDTSSGPDVPREDLISGKFGSVTVKDLGVKDRDKLDKCIDELNDLISRLGYKVGIAYENLETGAKIQYNTAKQFSTASTIKAPYVKFVLEQDPDLNEKIVVTGLWDDGDASIGQLTPADEGKEFTLRQLIEKTIHLSDNSAYCQLVRHFGTSRFNEAMQKLGVSVRISADYIFPTANAAEQCIMYKDIYDYACDNAEGGYLISMLTHCETDLQIGRALRDKYAVAQKYGADYDEDDLVYNDCAVCYAQKPFVLCILTQQEPNTDESNSFFREAAVIFDRINDLIY